MIDLNLTEPEAPETPADKRAREAYEKWADAQRRKLDVGDFMGILKRFIYAKACE